MSEKPKCTCVWMKKRRKMILVVIDPFCEISHDQKEDAA